MKNCPSSQKGPRHMTSTHSAHARRRRMARAATFSLVLTLAPVVLIDGPASAQGAVAALSAGAQGDAVRAVQQALVNQGIPLAGGVDGVFGAGTVKAVKQFQSRNGLNATGVVDEATSLAGTVYAVEPLGDRTLVDVEIGGQRVIIKAPPTASYKVGEPVRAAVDMERVHLFDAESEQAIARR